MQSEKMAVRMVYGVMDNSSIKIEISTVISYHFLDGSWGPLEKEEWSKYKPKHRVVVSAVFSSWHWER